MGQFNRIAAAVQANNFANDTALYTAAVEDARARAPYTYFDQHIIQREDGTYAVIDEGDYERPHGGDDRAHRAYGGAANVRRMLV